MEGLDSPWEHFGGFSVCGKSSPIHLPELAFLSRTVQIPEFSVNATPLITWNVAGASKELNFTFDFILIIVKSNTTQRKGGAKS